MTVTEAEELLVQAKFSAVPTDNIGRKFLFDCPHGSHHEILFGTITGLSISDESGLTIFLSTPRFWGEPLHALRFNNGKWYTVTDDRPIEGTLLIY